MELVSYLLTALPIIGGVTLFIILLMNFRIVVSTNDVDVVQRRSHSIAYGKNLPSGNTYYKWPSWVPYFGVQVTSLPVSVFQIALKDYAAYDKGRVPFIIDIIGFFRIADPIMASERLIDVKDLQQQLMGILQGAIRSILASSEIEEILEGRSRFGDMFTEAVGHQLEQWGVSPVKTIELMDIRDANDSKVIANIMMKKKSLIEMQSRVAVAGNMQTAQTAEIDAKQAVGIREQDALQAVSVRTYEQKRMSEIAREQATQAVNDQIVVTTQKEMAIKQVTEVRAAEIEKQVQIVAAERAKEVMLVAASATQQQAIVTAEGEKQRAVLLAEGMLEQRTREATAIQLKGEAEGTAKYALEVAPLNAQIVLAKEIGQNKEYQAYLVNIRSIEKDQAIGVEQAKALEEADIKIIANTGTTANAGLKSVTDLLSAAGGTAIGAAIEGLAQTPTGEAIVKKLTNGKGNVADSR